jgi:DNA recombination protein RmuC
LIIVIGLTLYRMKQEKKTPNNLTSLLQQISDQQGQQLHQTTNLVLQQLTRQQESQDRSSHLMHSRIDQATKVVSDVQGKLLQLEEANKRIFDLGKDINNLQRILQAPKLRGTMGEIWLAELISQIIPGDRFKLQYAFKSGEICDAVILLRDGLLLPIDAKFSLENFVKMLEAPDDQKALFKKQFVQDMKKRIDEIAKKYILPHENTLDFAFMYVPAENVYYQAFIQEEDTSQLLAYAFSKHIIPVSPSSFYAYLQVILFGLRGLEIEKSAKVIQKNLAGLQGEFDKFKETYEKVGTHLRHAQQSFDVTDKRLTGIENKFFQITNQEPPLISTDNEEL